ncbi:MAG: FtsQ-type POTRA domain-containing protein [Candidatus Falkowbacteria bacterium]
MSREGKYHKKIKKDYQCKNLSNPFFHQPKKKPNKRLFACLIIAIVVFIIFIFWFFMAAPFWQINNIKVEGLTRISSDEIINKIKEQEAKSRYGVFKQTNIWLFDEQEAQDSILSSYNLASLEIIKRPAKTLIIKVGERPYSYIFQQGNQFFYSAIDACIIPEAVVSEDDKSKYLILENRNAENLINDKNKINISDAYLNFILELANQITTHPELSVERFVIDQEFNTIKVKFRDGPLVYFNTKTDAKAQIERLVLVKKEKIKDNFSKTNYIDLRYGDRIFIN